MTRVCRSSLARSLLEVQRLSTGIANAGTGLTSSEVWEQFDVLPIQHCPHCGRVLQRRQTVWLAENA